jgi:Peptidase C13 family
MLLVGCQQVVSSPPSPIVVEPPRLEAVLAAGDWAEPVFDNATRALANRLIAAGTSDRRIHVLSADARAIRGGHEPSALPRLLDRIRTLTPGEGGGCFVYLTSHGEPKRGLWLARSRRVLTPAELDAALAAGCGAVPTVVVVSSCYAGVFARPPMTRTNRIVITAARADRPSFGCQADRTYTYFDECFLAALDGAVTWRDIHARGSECVARKERTMPVLPSEPQAYFGPEVATLAAPWQLARHGPAR